MICRSIKINQFNWFESDQIRSDQSDQINQINPQISLLNRITEHRRRPIAVALQWDLVGQQFNQWSRCIEASSFWIINQSANQQTGQNLWEKNAPWPWEWVCRPAEWSGPFWGGLFFRKRKRDHANQVTRSVATHPAFEKENSRRVPGCLLFLSLQINYIL